MSSSHGIGSFEGMKCFCIPEWKKNELSVILELLAYFKNANYI